MRLDDVQEHFGDKIVIEWKSFMLRSTEAGRKSWGARDSTYIQVIEQILIERLATPASGSHSH